MIAHSASGHLINPRAEALIVAQRWQSTVDFQEDIFDHVVDCGFRFYPTCNEEAKDSLDISPTDFAAEVVK